MNCDPKIILSLSILTKNNVVDVSNFIIVENIKFCEEQKSI